MGQQYYLNRTQPLPSTKPIQEEERKSNERNRPYAAEPAPRRDSRAAIIPGPPPPLDVERAIAELKRFLDLAVREMDLALEYEITSATSRQTKRKWPCVFSGADQELLLERNAELLLALEHIAHRWLRLDPRLHDRVRFDCGDYRATRLEELKLSARVAAQRVRETGQPFHFNPMSSRERRIVHWNSAAPPECAPKAKAPATAASS